jgi:hypothetical protein
MEIVQMNDNKPVGIRGSLEKFTDEEMSSVEFVKPLVDEIRKEVVAPAVDLTSPESAREAFISLQETARKLEQYQSRVGQLKGLLEQEKIDIESH